MTGAPDTAEGVAPDQNRFMTQALGWLQRCGFCGRAHPTLSRVYFSGANGESRADGEPKSKWAAYSCSTCGSLTVAEGVPGQYIGSVAEPRIWRLYPQPRAAHSLLPPAARTYLQQAIESLHAPDGAAVLAGSAVDAMLKNLGYEKGSLYDRIDKALEDRVLTQGMADWAHSVRLGSNRPRHADKDSPHVSAADAKRSVDFAEALGNFLFVLSAQIAEAVEQVSTSSE